MGREKSSDAGIIAGAVAGSVAGVAGVAEVGRRSHNAKALAGRSIPQAGHLTMAHAPSFSGAESHALKTYSGYAFGMVNEHLRTGRIMGLMQDGRMVESPKNADMLKSMSRDIGSAFERSGIQSATLFRGTGTDRTGPITAGSVVEDKGITSTSTSPKEASRFYDHAAKTGRSPVMMVIDAKGGRGIDMQPFSKFGYEKEVALAPGTKMRVDHVAKGVRSSIFDLRGKDYAFAHVEGGEAQTAAAVKAAARADADVARRLNALTGPVEPARVAMQRDVARGMRTPATGGMAQSIMKASALTTPIAAASIATLAYKQARDAGKSEARASLEAAGAGASATVAPAAIGAIAAHIGKSSSIGAKALGIASRALMPVSVIGHAGAYAYQAMQRGEGFTGVAKAAGWGAVNGIIPVDLAMDAYRSVRGTGPSASADPSAMSKTGVTPPAGAPQQDFAAADAAFRAKWAAGKDKAAAEKGSGAGEAKRGWANPAVQHAAQAGRGVQQFSDWAEPGKAQ